MNLFRELNEKEEKEFRNWARENYKAGELISKIWHPIVQDECDKMNRSNELDDDGNCLYCGQKCFEGECCDEQQAGGFS